MNDQDLLKDPEELQLEKEQALQDLAEREEYLKDWREVLSTPAGRRIIWDLIGGMGFQARLFNSDPLVMAANCRGHEIAVKLLKDIEEAMPGIYSKMTNELKSALGRKEK